MSIQISIKSVVKLTNKRDELITVILYGVDPLSYFSFQPVHHDWFNKGCGMYYPVW